MKDYQNQEQLVYVIIVQFKKKNLAIYKISCKKKKELKLKNNSKPNEVKIYKTVNGKLGLKPKKQPKKTRKKR